MDACVKHDEAYYYGGPKELREAADRLLAERWKEAGVSAIIRGLAIGAIRAFGGPGARTPGVSWAFGEEYFQYSEEPAIPEDTPVAPEDTPSDPDTEHDET